jgi:hypothetical protein
LGVPLKNRISASHDNLSARSRGNENNNNNNGKTAGGNFMASLSPRNNWPHESDSGLTSQKSNSTVTSSTHSSLNSDSSKQQMKSGIQGATKRQTPVRASSIPRRMNHSSLGAGLNSPSSPVANDLAFKNQTREEIINTLQQALNENLILKRQIDCKN